MLITIKEKRFIRINLSIYYSYLTWWALLRIICIPIVHQRYLFVTCLGPFLFWGWLAIWINILIVLVWSWTFFLRILFFVSLLINARIYILDEFSLMLKWLFVVGILGIQLQIRLLNFTINNDLSVKVFISELKGFDWASVR